MYIINLVTTIATALTLVDFITLRNVCDKLASEVARQSAFTFGHTTGIFDSRRHHPATATAKVTDDGFTVRIETNGYFDDRSNYSDSDIRSAFDELRLGGNFETFLQDSEIVWKVADELECMINAQDIKEMFASNENFDPEDLCIDTDVKRVDVNVAENRYDTEIDIRIECEIF